jgi:hypothetical protein
MQRIKPDKWIVNILLLPYSLFILSMVTGAFSTASAQSDTDHALQASVQSIGANTRAEITRVGNHGANVSRALRLQSDGDQALRRGELAIAAEDYGRAREALSVLDRERKSAIEERSRARLELERAQKAGDDIGWAAEKISDANRAFDAGNYVDAEIDFAEARADLKTR